MSVCVCVCVCVYIQIDKDIDSPSCVFDSPVHSFLLVLGAVHP